MKETKSLQKNNSEVVNFYKTEQDTIEKELDAVKNELKMISSGTEFKIVLKQSNKTLILILCTTNGCLLIHNSHGSVFLHFASHCHIFVSDCT